MISSQGQNILLKTAEEAIRNGLMDNPSRPFKPEASAWTEELSRPGASFVTLHLKDELRGCMGCLQSHRPLIEDVAANAQSAAFRDPRFAPVTENERADLRIHISILNPPVELKVSNETDLLKKLRPGIDGLILKDGPHQATFLPAVWEDLSNPRDFVAHLKRKAGLPEDYWSPSMRFETYTVQSFGEE